MFIKFEDIKNKYNLNISNVLHVGAHEAEEHDDYFSNGCKKVYWVEANEELVKKLKTRLDVGTNQVFCEAVSDTDDQEIQFLITNNLQSSSILELGTHKEMYPNIFVYKQVTMETKTIKTILEENNIDSTKIDFINLDIQGAELKALKGAGIALLDSIKAIYTEINTQQVYKGCGLLEEIDAFLLEHGLIRVETYLADQNAWGDALYVRGTLL
jgi:FkbM family methyltransferase